MYGGPDGPNKIKEEIKEVPFKGNLVESRISGRHKGSGKMNEIVKTGLNERIKRLNYAKLDTLPQQLGYREKIIRVQGFDEFIRIQSSDEFGHDNTISYDTIAERVQAAKKLFEELEKKCGITVPAKFLIGKNKNGDKVIYSVVDKIQGISLDLIDTTSSDEVIAQTERLYTSVS